MNLLNKLPQNVQDIINGRIEVAHALGSVTQVQEDNDGIGIIVDIYDQDGEEVLFSETYEYSDYPLVENVKEILVIIRSMLMNKEQQFFTDQEQDDLDTAFIDAPRVTYYDEYFYNEYAIKAIEYGRTVLVPIGDADDRMHTVIDDLSDSEVIYLASCLD